MIVTGGNVFLAGMSSCYWSKRQPLHISDDLYTVTSYPRDSLTGSGDRKKEGDEREWGTIQIKFLVNKAAVHLILKLNADALKEREKMQN